MLQLRRKDNPSSCNTLSRQALQTVEDFIHDDTPINPDDIALSHGTWHSKIEDRSVQKLNSPTD